IRSGKSRPDGQLDFAAAALHALEGLREVGQANLFRHEIMPDYVAAADGFKGLANEPRSVMKGRNEFNLGVVNGGRIDGYVRPRRQTTEEIQDAATPDHGQRLMPRRRIPGG